MGLTAGQSATLSFWVANAFEDTPSGLDVSIGSLSLLNLSNTPSGSFPPGNFVNYTATFVSPSDNPTLLFSGFNDPGGIVVDDVSIQTAQAIPEPLTLLGAGTAIAFGTVFKRRLAQNRGSRKV